MLNHIRIKGIQTVSKHEAESVLGDDDLAVVDEFLQAAFGAQKDYVVELEADAVQADFFVFEENARILRLMSLVAIAAELFVGI